MLNQTSPRPHGLGIYGGSPQRMQQQVFQGHSPGHLQAYQQQQRQQQQQHPVYQQGPPRYSIPSTPPHNSPHRNSQQFRQQQQQTSPSPGPRHYTSSSPNRPSPLHMPPSPTRGQGVLLPQTSPNRGQTQRLIVHNPDPQAAPQQQSQQSSFALRPTHSAPRGGAFSTFSSIPPPPQPSFAPAANSPLRAMADNRMTQQGYERAESEPPPPIVDDEQPSSADSSSKSSALSIGQIKTAEVRRLSRGNDENNNSTQRNASDDESDEEERIRLPSDHPRASQQVPQVPRGVRLPSGPPTTLAPPAPESHTSSWDQSKERLAAEFPVPPSVQDRPYMASSPGSPSTSNDSCVTAKTTQGGSQTALIQPVVWASSDESATAPSVPGGVPPASKHPWPAQASPSKKADRALHRQSDPLVGRHSRNQALFAAETGGMIMLDGDRISPGEGPGEVSKMPQQPSIPGYPPVPATAPRSPLSQEVRPEQAPPPFLQAAQPFQQFHEQNQQRWSDVSDPETKAQQWANGNTPGLDFSRPRSHNNSGDSGDRTSFESDLSRRRAHHARRHSDGEALARQGTLFHPASNSERAAQELDVMLGKPRSRRLSANKILAAPDMPKNEKVRLEASKKSRARVELDVVLERECVVEGCELRGRLEVVVNGGKNANGLRVGAGKIRVLGFEELAGSRHIFYQHQYQLPLFGTDPNGPRSSLFADGRDEEAFRLAREGTHTIPFSVPLPVGEGARGCYTSPNNKGPNVRYVVVGSLKLHIPQTRKRAIAHFYRPLVLLPYLNPASALAPSRSPLVHSVESGLGWSIGGEKGKVGVQVALGRRNWVSGQRVWCEVSVKNDSNKKINKCALAVIQTVHVFGAPTKGKGRCIPQDPVSTTKKKIAEEFIEADFMALGTGHVTGKSWWTGLEPGEWNRWDMSVPIPSGMISIPRGQFVEVSYVLRVTVNGSIYVDAPLRLINFQSIDPPPMASDTRRIKSGRVPVPAHTQQQSLSPTLSEQQNFASRAAQAGGTAGPPPLGGAAGYTLTQLRSAADSNLPAARTSSTTLNIDALLAQGRERAEAAGRKTVSPAPGAPDELDPRPMSPGSQYSSVNGGTVKSRATALTRANSTVKSEMSIDEEERNHLLVEQHRREGRLQSLAVIQDEQGENESVEWIDSGHSNSSHGDPDAIDGRSFKPAGDVSEVAYNMDGDTDDGHLDDAASDVTDNDRTPVASPFVSPGGPPSRSQFLAHISEASEEELDDDMLDEMMSAESHQAGSHLHYDGEDGADDLLVDQSVGTETPRPGDEYTPRRSLEDRLARACDSSKVSPVNAVSGLAAATAAGAAGAAMAGGKERPFSVDYAEPIDLDNISLSDHDYDADGMSEGTSTHGVSPPRTRHMHTTSLPQNWELPSPDSVRDISWGRTLAGRTVSGRTAVMNFDDNDFIASPSSATFGTRALPPYPGHLPVSPSSPGRLQPDSDYQTLSAAAHARSPRDEEQQNLPSLDEEDEFAPPNMAMLTGQDTDASQSSPSAQSFVTANSDLEVPPLARSAGSDSSDAGSFESHERQREGHQEMYTSMPLPAPPTRTAPSVPPPPQRSPAQRSSMTIPDRFRPSPPKSDDTHATHETDMSSTVSTNYDSVVLPAVRARVAQIDSREEALRRFTVASIAGLSGQQPLSPVHSGTASASSCGRRSYTSALGVRSSPRSATFAPEDTGPRSPRFADAASYQPPAYEQATTPTRREQVRSWNTSVAEAGEDNLSGSASRLLQRALSSSSTSTTATEVEIALSSPTRSPVVTPRGPRTARVTMSPSSAPVIPPFTAPMFASSPAHTPTQSFNPLPDMMIRSETASLSDLDPEHDVSDLGHAMGSLSTRDHGTITTSRGGDHEVLQDQAGYASEDVGSGGETSGSEFGNTGWTGGMRLPPMRVAGAPGVKR